MIDSVKRILLRSGDLLTRPPVLTLYAAIHAGVVLALALAYLAGIDRPTGNTPGKVVVGDYLALLTGAGMLQGAESTQLYDLTAQKALQERLAGIPLTAWQPYVYPPLLAMLLWPLAGLPFASGLHLFTGATLGAALVAGVSLARMLPAVRSARAGALTTVLLTIGFFPLASTLPGRQTTAITLALLCGSLLALQAGRSALGGTLVGLLSYKPQFMLPLIAVLAWRRQWRALGACATVCALHYLAAAALLGLDWPIGYLSGTREIAALEMAQNAARHFSVLPLARSMTDAPAAPVAAGLLLAGLLFLGLRRAPRANPGAPEFPMLWSMATVAGMLASPYLQHYEFGLVLLPCAVAIDRLLAAGHVPGLGVRVLLAAVFAGYPLLVSGDASSRSLPLGILLALLFLWLCRVAPARDAASTGAR
jgi:hypothetical protein